MGKSYIISSSDNTFVEQELSNILKTLNLIANESEGDCIRLELLDKKQSIGIDQIQMLRKWSKAKPFRSDNKLAVIYQAEKMTQEAQNAILKMLEEPNESNNYILLTTNHSKLLETILSRCILLMDNKFSLQGRNINDFLDLNTLGKIDYINKLISEKDIILRNEKIDQMLMGLLSFYRDRLHGGENVLSKINVVNQTRKLIESNVSVKNALTYLCLNIDI